jgi:translation elongation factor EF-1alpha
MNMTSRNSRDVPTWRRVALLVSICGAVGAPGLALATTTAVTLQGEQEVPSVKTVGTATGSITINDDRSVSGSVTTQGIAGTKAHIHEGAAGKNGPVVIELVKSGDTWSVPSGAVLTDSQYASYKSAQLYVNVHTATHPKGEMRAQLQP